MRIFIYFEMLNKMEIFDYLTWRDLTKQLGLSERKARLIGILHLYHWKLCLYHWNSMSKPAYVAEVALILYYLRCDLFFGVHFNKFLGYSHVVPWNPLIFNGLYFSGCEKMVSTERSKIE